MYQQDRAAQDRNSPVAYQQSGALSVPGDRGWVFKRNWEYLINRDDKFFPWARSICACLVLALGRIQPCLPVNA